MIQTFEGVTARLSGWLAADPKHAEIWLAIGLALAIASIALLAIEQMKARAAQQS
jgi:hypothetical protein